MTNAIDIIGAQAEDDYLFDPSKHATLYRTSAPALAAVLDDPHLSLEQRNFREQDAKSIAAQALYKSTMLHGSLAVFAAAVLGALMLAAEVLIKDGHLPAAASVTLSVLAGISGAYAVYTIYRLREGKMLEKWMGARAKAETHRIGYFEALAARAEVSKNPEFLGLLLEYFRRYQLDVQTTFYGRRGERHEKDANRTVTLGAIGAGVAALANLGGVGGGWWTLLGTLGIAGAALTTFAIAREQANQDRRNAERYLRTRETLDGIAARLGAVREAAAQGNGAAVKEFMAAIDEQVSLEHRQWLEGSEAAAAALAKLEQSLTRPGGGKKP